MPWSSQFGYGIGGYGIGPYGGGFAYDVSDTELLKRMQYMLLENGNADATGQAPLLTSMFTIQQFIDALNSRFYQFLRDTGCVLSIAFQPSVAGTARYLLPPDWIFTRRLDWQATPGGQRKALARTDSFELDNELTDWQQNLDLPVVYNDGSDLPTLTVELAKAPVQDGTMFLDYVAQPVTLTGTGTFLSMPDEIETALLYGAMATLLGQEAEAHDLERAQYCEGRYALTVELTKALMEGADGRVPTSA